MLDRAGMMQHQHQRVTVAVVMATEFSRAADGYSQECGAFEIFGQGKTRQQELTVAQNVFEKGVPWSLSLSGVRLAWCTICGMTRMPCFQTTVSAASVCCTRAA